MTLFVSLHGFQVTHKSHQRQTTSTMRVITGLAHLLLPEHASLLGGDSAVIVTECTRKETTAQSLT
jgi:hypothetical protein